MMTVKQVAEQLLVSEACVYQLIQSGQLWAHRIGLGRGTIRISADDLEAYLADNRTRKIEKRRPPRKRATSLKLNHLRVMKE